MLLDIVQCGNKGVYRKKGYVRCTESETRNDCDLLRLSHLQFPDGSDGQDEDEDVGDDVGRDERLEHQDLVDAVSQAFQRPLLLNGAAEEDEAERESDGPDYDERSTKPDPVTEVQGEHSIVEAQLAKLEAGKRPKVDQGERECDLSC
jgi:hypothetical protein